MMFTFVKDVALSLAVGVLLTMLVLPALVLTGNVSIGGSASAATVSTATASVVHEDSPEWDCASMGNLVCGPDSVVEHSASVLCRYLNGTSQVVIGSGCGATSWYVGDFYGMTSQESFATCAYADGFGDDDCLLAGVYGDGFMGTRWIH